MPSPVANDQTLCEVLDKNYAPLCVMPLADILRQRLCHRWVSALVTDQSRLLLGGEAGLELPFLAPLPAGASSEDLALELVNPWRLAANIAAPPRAVRLGDGRLLQVFRLTVAPASLSARAWAGMEPVKRTDLPFFAAKNMLGPLVTELMAANVSL